MLYEELKVILPRQSLLPTTSSNNILKMPKTEIKDIINLYIYTAGILKWLWDETLLTAKPKLDKDGNYIPKLYQAKDIDYLILSNGANLSNKKILSYVVREITKMLQEYLESCLIKRNPQLDFFKQFIDWNFLWMKYVFNISSYNNSLVLIYTNGLWEEIEVSDQNVFHKMAKDELEDIEAHNSLPDRIKYLLQRLKIWSFPKWKKFLLNALREQFKGNDVLEDGKYMSELEYEVWEINKKEEQEDRLQEEKELKEEDNKKDQLSK